MIKSTYIKAELKCKLYKMTICNQNLKLCYSININTTVLNTKHIQVVQTTS